MTLIPLFLYLGVDLFYTLHIMLFYHQYLLKYFIDMDLTNCFPSPIPLDPKIKLYLEMNSPYYRMGVSFFMSSTFALTLHILLVL